MKHLAILSVLALSACAPDPTLNMEKPQSPQMQPGGVPSPDTQRVTVSRVGIFSDDLAYGDRRGVYVIIDKETGREYIGVSGVGISETGRHFVPQTTIVGKAVMTTQRPVSDER